MTEVAIVTGGAGGIGSAIVRRLAYEGLTVVAADLDAALVHADFEGRTDVALEPVDVTSTASVDAMVAAAAARGRLHAVVNCAGTLRPTPVDSLADDDLEVMLSVNLAGAMRVCRAAIPHMGDGASIVNISSISALRGSAPRVGVYAATKAGLEAYTRSAAVDLAKRGIRVNAVAPGFTRAPLAAIMRGAGDERLVQLVPLRRLAEPEDIAEAVEFLVSERASYITGVVLPVDGGILAK